MRNIVYIVWTGARRGVFISLFHSHFLNAVLWSWCWIHFIIVFTDSVTSFVALQLTWPTGNLSVSPEELLCAWLLRLANFRSNGMFRCFLSVCGIYNLLHIFIYSYIYIDSWNGLTSGGFTMMGWFSVDIGCAHTKVTNTEMNITKPCVYVSLCYWASSFYEYMLYSFIL